MGLFSQQPEQEDEWAGIPSEPLAPESDAERLRDAALIDAAGLGVLGTGMPGTGAAVKTIVIPVAPLIEITESQDSGEDDGPG